MKVASISGGKDSVAMLHLMVEKGNKPDMAIFYDNGMEFNATYNVIEKVSKYCQKSGIEFIRLQSSFNFLEYMLYKEVKGRTNGTKGYSWCGGSCRWGTSDKEKVISGYLSQYSDVKEYIGIAYDEKDRAKNKNYPLIEYGYTEKMCLDYCYSLGYDWEEDGIRLYSILKRVSCWCCANKNLKELYNIYRFLPAYWKKLKELEEKTFKTMKKGYTLHELEERFKCRYYE